MDSEGQKKLGRVGTWVLTCSIVVWIGAVVILAGSAFWSKFTVGQSPGDNKRHHAAHYEVALAVVLVAVPVLVAALALATRHKVTAIVLLVLSAVLVAPALYLGRVGIDDGRAGHTQSATVPAVTQCIPRSGSTHSCPGG